MQWLSPLGNRSQESAVTNRDEIQAEIDGKDRLLEREQIARKMWALLALTHLAALFIPWAPVTCLGAGLLMWMLGRAECMRLVREISALAKQRKSIDEQVDAFVEERGDAIRRRMQAMMEAEAREQARRRNLPAMFKGNCIDVTPEKH
jgi:hypothetical protein